MISSRMSTAFSRSRICVRAVEALVCHSHGPAGHVVALLERPDDLPDPRPLALVAGIYLEPHRHAPRVEQEPHADYGVSPPLLGGPLPAQAVLAVYLEVEVRAVEVGA